MSEPRWRRIRLVARALIIVTLLLQAILWAGAGTPPPRVVGPLWLLMLAAAIWSDP